MAAPNKVDAGLQPHGATVGGPTSGELGCRFHHKCNAGGKSFIVKGEWQHSFHRVLTDCGTHCGSILVSIR